MTDLYTISDVSVTNYSQIDKVFRLKNRIKSRYKGLAQQLSSLTRSGAFSRYSKPYKLFADNISILKSLYNRLDVYNVICNENDSIDTQKEQKELYLSVYQHFMLFPHSIEEHTRMLSGGLYNQLSYDGPCDPVIKRLMEIFKKGSLKARARDAKALLMLEGMQRVKEGWFVVFNTLTYNDGCLDKVFGYKSTAWTDYVRKFDREVGITTYGTWQKAIEARQNGEEFHTYFAVVERGGKTGRLHLHAIHFMKKLPHGCVDPNVGLTIPYKREIEHMKSYWEFGDSHPIAVRFNNSDAYGLGGLKWRWPVDTKKGTIEPSKAKPLKCSNAEAIIFYVSKYVNKGSEKEIKNEEVIRWRVKKSRNLGIMYLNKLIDRCSPAQLQTIMVSNAWTLRLFNQALPLKKLKLLSLRRLIQMWMLKDARNIMNSVRELKPRENILKQLILIIQKKAVSKTLSAGDIKALTLLSTEGSNLIRLIHDVGVEFFGSRKTRYEVSTYTGGLFYG